MTAMVRAQSLRGYPELVNDLGGSPARLLHGAGIDPVVLNQLTGFISFGSLIELLERSASALDCPDFGLRLAERQDIGVLGTLAVAMRYATTVGDALQLASKYLEVYNGALAFDISAERRSGRATLAFDVLEAHAPIWAQTAEHGLGLAWRITTVLSEGRSRLRQVWFPHQPVGNDATYRVRFDGLLTFGGERAALAIDASDLDFAVSEQNETLRDLAVSYLRSQIPASGETFQAHVRRAVEAHLGTGTCSYRSVASSLYMHPRTLQRRLRDEGTSFEEIKDETRRDLAQRYLAQPDVPLSQVTALLDYSEQSALGRSCRRWFHATPRAVRDRLTTRRPALAMA